MRAHARGGLMADNEAPTPGQWSGLAQLLAAAGSPPGLLSGIGSLSHMAQRGLAFAPWVMAQAGRSRDDLPDTLAHAAMADFRGPLAGLGTRDLLVNYLMKPLYGPEAANAFSSLIGPMDDPVRQMAQAINGGDKGQGF